MRLLPSLLAGLRAVCATFPDPRKGRGGNIAMADFGLAAFALFFMSISSGASHDGAAAGAVAGGRHPQCRGAGLYASTCPCPPADRPRLAEHPDRWFADHAAWTEQLERLGIAALKVNLDPVHFTICFSESGQMVRANHTPTLECNSLRYSVP